MTKAISMAENLRDGEIYAGLLLGKNGAPDTHLFLLPGSIEKVSWKQAKDWAEKTGGELPTRREQALLFANLKEEFSPEWYWSNQQLADNSDYAWSQYFSHGHQDTSHKSAAGRARAVRRSIIQ